MKKIYFVLLISLLVVCGLFGQSKVGTTAAPFLNVGIGSKAVSMGGAFIGTSDDVSALYWNPAGIARLAGNEAQFSYTKWFADITFNWAGASVNLYDLGAIGLSMTYLDYGEMEVTTMKEQDGTGEMFTAKDMVFALTYAYQLTDRFSIGMNFKYINQKIWNSSADAFAVDIGTLFQSDILGTRIGATISNFGTDMKLDGKDLYVLHDINSNINGNNDQILALLKTDQYPLPLIFKVGIALDPINIANHKLTIGADWSHPNDNDENINVGMEYVLYDMLALRAGYKSLFLSNSEEGLTFGFGLNYNFAPNLGIYLNYAYQDFGVFKNTQHFSIGLKF